MKIDPYKHKEKYLAWKNSINGKIPDISEQNSTLILNYIFDMEQGLNVSSVSKKGCRSYIRLNDIKQRVIYFVKQFERRYNLTDITQTSERNLHEFFTGMRNGTILRMDGQIYRSPGDYVKVFKAFWHWHQKVNRKKGVEIQDITIDLDTSKEKPDWVYLTEDQVKQLVDNAKYEYKVLIMFLFDSGIRAPTELMNIRVSDFYSDFKELNIRDEVSKTFGRRIKLMLCTDYIKNFISMKKLGQEDYLFTKKCASMNKYLKRLGKRILGDSLSPGGQRYSELTMYDFRHCSCCYWLPRYSSESALKYRFGWKKSDKIHYYSELLGMKDTITEDDLLLDTTKTELQNRIQQLEQKERLNQDKIAELERYMKKFDEWAKKVYVSIS